VRKHWTRVKRGAWRVWRSGGVWDIWHGDDLIEGGFFSRAAAVAAMIQYEQGVRA
jgi:hypothetical protein